MPQRDKQSETKRAFTEDGALKTHVGGQALMEGIMMRGKYNYSIAVRTPSGDIHIENHDLASGKKKNSWTSWPLVRGCVAMVQSLALGYKAIEISALHAYDDEGESWWTLQQQGKTPTPNNAAEATPDAITAPAEQPQPAPQLAESQASTAQSQAAQQPTEALNSTKGQASVIASSKAHDDDKKEETRATAKSAQQAENTEDSESFIGKGVIGASMVIGLVLGIALFIVLPAAISNLIVGEYDSNPIVWNIIDGIIRVAIFVFYIWLIGQMKEIKRLFRYHGAEHKTIHCFEHGLPLTPENAQSFPRLHIRCGTAFLIMVMLIAILVYTIIPLNSLITAWGVPDGFLKLALVIAVRIIFLPLIAGISYEITVKWAGTHPDNPLVKIVLWPGMQMQRLTTKEPDASMIECAIAAMKEVLAREEAEEQSSSELLAAK